MDKKQQIEEMAKEYCKNEFYCSKYCQTEGCKIYEICEELYNAGYRKIDDDCAVITKDELKQYKVQAVKEFAEKLKMISFYEFGEITLSIMYDIIDEFLKELEEWKTISSN